MLFANRAGAARQDATSLPDPAGVLASAVWIDMVDPTEAERQLVKQATGLRLSSREDLSEIETSSRLSTENDMLYLSVNLHVQDAQGVPHTQPLGLLVGPDRLVTIRFTEAVAFDQFVAHVSAMAGAPTGAELFLGLLETIVERLADILELTGAELDAISRRVFRPEDPHDHNPARTSAQLRATLRGIGRAGDRLSNLRDSLLGIQRIVFYTAKSCAARLPPGGNARLKTLRYDIGSLTEYDAQLSAKSQFMLDATLGFINIEQNNSIKVMAVVSVAGVPPTLVASIYGMNFKYMPELDWTLGYPWGLGLILISGIIPLIWFRKRGWI